MPSTNTFILDGPVEQIKNTGAENQTQPFVLDGPEDSTAPFILDGPAPEQGVLSNIANSFAQGGTFPKDMYAHFVEGKPTSQIQAEQEAAFPTTPGIVSDLSRMGGQVATTIGGMAAAAYAGAPAAVVYGAGGLLGLGQGVYQANQRGEELTAKGMAPTAGQQLGMQIAEGTINAGANMLTGGAAGVALGRGKTVFDTVKNLGKMAAAKEGLGTAFAKGAAQEAAINMGSIAASDTAAKVITGAPAEDIYGTPSQFGYKLGIAGLGSTVPGGLFRRSAQKRVNKQADWAGDILDSMEFGVDKDGNEYMRPKPKVTEADYSQDAEARAARMAQAPVAPVTDIHTMLPEDYAALPAEQKVDSGRPTYSYLTPAEQKVMDANPNSARARALAQKASFRKDWAEHRAAVESALAAGKAVPDEVIKQHKGLWAVEQTKRRAQGILEKEFADANAARAREVQAAKDAQQAQADRLARVSGMRDKIFNLQPGERINLNTFRAGGEFAHLKDLYTGRKAQLDAQKKAAEDAAKIAEDAAKEKAALEARNAKADELVKQIHSGQEIPAKGFVGFPEFRELYKQVRQAKKDAEKAAILAADEIVRREQEMATAKERADLQNIVDAAVPGLKREDFGKHTDLWAEYKKRIAELKQAAEEQAFRDKMEAERIAEEAKAEETRAAQTAKDMESARVAEERDLLARRIAEAGAKGEVIPFEEFGPHKDLWEAHKRINRALADEIIKARNEQAKAEQEASEQKLRDEIAAHKADEKIYKKEKATTLRYWLHGKLTGNPLLVPTHPTRPFEQGQAQVRPDEFWEGIEHTEQMDSGHYKASTRRTNESLPILGKMNRGKHNPKLTTDRNKGKNTLAGLYEKFKADYPEYFQAETGNNAAEIEAANRQRFVDMLKADADTPLRISNPERASQEELLAYVESMTGKMDTAEADEAFARKQEMEEIKARAAAAEYNPSGNPEEFQAARKKKESDLPDIKGATNKAPFDTKDTQLADDVEAGNLDAVKTLYRGVKGNYDPLSSGQTMSEQGITWFTENKQLAEEFANDWKGNKGTVHSAQVDVSGAFDPRNPEHFAQMEAAASEYVKEYYGVKAGDPEYNNAMRRLQRGTPIDDWEVLAPKIKELGFSALKSYEANSVSYGVFDTGIVDLEFSTRKGKNAPMPEYDSPEQIVEAHSQAVQGIALELMRNGVFSSVIINKSQLYHPTERYWDAEQGREMAPKVNAHLMFNKPGEAPALMLSPNVDLNTVWHEVGHAAYEVVGGDDPLMLDLAKVFNGDLEQAFNAFGDIVSGKFFQSQGPMDLAHRTMLVMRKLVGKASKLPGGMDRLQLDAVMRLQNTVLRSDYALFKTRTTKAMIDDLNRYTAPRMSQKIQASRIKSMLTNDPDAFVKQTAREVYGRPSGYHAEQARVILSDPVLVDRLLAKAQDPDAGISPAEYQALVALNNQVARVVDYAAKYGDEANLKATKVSLRDYVLALSAAATKWGQSGAYLQTPLTLEATKMMIEHQLGKDLTPAQMKLLEDVAPNAEALAKMIGKVKDPTAKDFIGNWVRSSLLLGGAIPNSIWYNTLMLGFKVANYPVRAGLDSLLSVTGLRGLVAGEKARQYLWRDVAEYYKGLAKGFTTIPAKQKALIESTELGHYVNQNLWADWAYNLKKEAESLTGGKYITNRMKAVLAKIGHIQGYSIRLMELMDRQFRNAAFEAEVQTRASRWARSQPGAEIGNMVFEKARKLYLDSLENNPDLLAQIHNSANSIAFMDDGGPILNALKSFRNAVDEVSPVIPLGTAIVPFMHTAGRAMNFTFDIMPGVGLAKGLTKKMNQRAEIRKWEYRQGKEAEKAEATGKYTAEEIEAIRNKPWNKEKVDMLEVLANQALGTGLAAILLAWADGKDKDGHPLVVGKTPIAPGLKAVFHTGLEYRPYSVQIPQGLNPTGQPQYLEMSRFGSFAPMLQSLVALKDTLLNPKEPYESGAKMLQDFLQEFSKITLDSSFLEQPSKLLSGTAPLDRAADSLKGFVPFSEAGRLMGRAATLYLQGEGETQMSRLIGAGSLQRSALGDVQGKNFGEEIVLVGLRMISRMVGPDVVTHVGVPTAKQLGILTNPELVNKIQAEKVGVWGGSWKLRTSVLSDLIAPARTWTPANDPTTKELYRLGRGINPPDEKIKIDPRTGRVSPKGLEMVMPFEMYDFVARGVGQKRKEVMDKLMSTTSWGSLPDNRKLGLVNRRMQMLEPLRLRLVRQYLRDNPALQERLAAQGRQAAVLQESQP